MPTKYERVASTFVATNPSKSQNGEGGDKLPYLSEIVHAGRGLSVKMLIMLATTLVAVCMLAPVAHFLREMPDARPVNVSENNYTKMHYFCYANAPTNLTLIVCPCTPAVVQVNTKTNELDYLREKMEHRHLIVPVTLAAVFVMIVVGLKMWHFWVVYKAKTHSIFTHVALPILSNLQFWCHILTTTGIFLFSFWLAGSDELSDQLSNIIITLLVGEVLAMTLILAQMGLFQTLAPHLANAFAGALGLKLVDMSVA